MYAHAPFVARFYNHAGEQVSILTLKSNEA